MSDRATSANAPANAARNTLGPAQLVFSSVPVSDRPVFDRLKPAREAGFEGISLLPTDIWEMAAQGIPAEVVGHRIRDEGLVICEVDCTAAWIPAQRAKAPANDMDRRVLAYTAEKVVDAAARVGARSITAVEMLGIRPSVDEAAESFAKLCDMAAEHGLLVHLEFLPFGGIPDLKSAWAIVESAGRPNGGLTIDSWHLFRSGSTLDELAAIPGDRIFTVQLDDAPGKPWDDMFSETLNGRLLPGEGSFDLAGMIRTLDAIGSKAPIEVEVMNAGNTNVTLEKIAQDWAAAARNVVAQARRKA